MKKITAALVLLVAIGLTGCHQMTPDEKFDDCIASAKAAHAVDKYTYFVCYTDAYGDE